MPGDSASDWGARPRQAGDATWRTVLDAGVRAQCTSRRSNKPSVSGATLSVPLPRRAAPRPNAPRLRAGRQDRRVLELPAEPRLRRAVDRLRGGSDAAGGARRDAAGGRPSSTSRRYWFSLEERHVAYDEHCHREHQDHRKAQSRHTSLPRLSRPSGYRVYDTAAVERVRFARELQGLGFTLDEVVDALHTV